MGENNYFSQIDLKNGFNQILLDEEIKKYTLFFLLGKQYQYLRTPFGMKPGPKVFQRNITKILDGIENIFLYIDDIIIFSKTEDEHSEILLKVL